MHRFFIPANLFQTSEVSLPAEVSKQICRVLRLRTGSEILLLDNEGYEYPAELRAINETHCTAMVGAKQPSQGEPATRLTLLVGITQREKFEMILQKCTEIGVSAIIPVITSRSLIQKSQDVTDKHERWKKIMLEAAEQSERGRIPQLLPAMKYADALSSIQEYAALKLVFWEEESGSDLKSILRNYQGQDVDIIIGPEGGLTVEEVETARAGGFKSVSLGRRILRMETAAMIASGLVIYELG